MLRRPLLAALALVGAPVGCATTPGAPARVAPDPPRVAAPAPPAAHPPSSAPGPVALEPELLDLLTAHRNPPPEAGDEPTPEPEFDPRASGLRLCEARCARPLDREALARRFRDRDAAARWLAAREPVTLHYPYVEIDGLRIDYDGDGRPLRCSHSIARVAGSRVEIDCASGHDPKDMSKGTRDH